MFGPTFVNNNVNRIYRLNKTKGAEYMSEVNMAWDR